MGVKLFTETEFHLGDGENTSTIVPMSPTPLPVVSMKFSFPSIAPDVVYIGGSDVALGVGIELVPGKTFTLTAPKKQWFDLGQIYFYTEADAFDGTGYFAQVSYVAKDGR